MTTSLKVLRQRTESQRFERLRYDDARTAVAPLDSQELARELKRVLRGEVRFDKGARALYSTDGSNYRQVPIGVVIPRDKGDVEATIELARKRGRLSSAGAAGRASLDSAAMSPW